MVIENTQSLMPGRQVPLESNAPELEAMVELDQLVAVRRNIALAVPINMMLGATCALIAFSHGMGVRGLLWLLISTIINLLRLLICRRPLTHPLIRWRPSRHSRSGQAPWPTRDHLRACSFSALLSGLVWAAIPLLCRGYTASTTLFYLTVVCGVTAGAVTYGTGYAKVPLAFITPPLSSVVLCLVVKGNFDRYCLAAMVLLYLLALGRSTFVSEKAFRDSSFIKNQATSFAKALTKAHQKAVHAEKQMRRQAWHDALTGLLNRSGFLDQASRFESNNRTNLCLMLLDLDGFKAVNDIYGHKAGDNVLAKVGERLRMTLPPNSVTARLGGDEFAILYAPGQPSDAPTELATRLIRTIPSAIELSNRLGASIGICSAPTFNLAEMLICADAALYAAKDSGRNQYRQFDDDLRSRLEIRRVIERDLPKALDNDNLEVWLQPILRLDTLKLDSVEALLRWRHDEHGWLPPPVIVDTATTSGQSERLLRFVLKKIIAVLRLLDERSMNELRVAINVSPRKMAQIRVDEILLETLSAAGVEPTRLELEITEETTADIEVVQRQLNHLYHAGVSIVVDDFGVGFSSLSTLRQPYISKVKIDQSLVTNLANTYNNQVLVKSILNLGQSLRINMVAEGIESEADLETLRALRCTRGQGFHLARPMPISELVKWITIRASDQ